MPDRSLGDDRVEVVLGHELVDCVLNRRRRGLPEGSALGVAAVRRLGSLEDRTVPGSLEIRIGGIEGDQVGERLRVRLARHRVRTVNVRLEVRRDVGLELTQKSWELIGGRRQVDVCPSITVAP